MNDMTGPWREYVILDGPRDGPHLDTHRTRISSAKIFRLLSRVPFTLQEGVG